MSKLQNLQDEIKKWTDKTFGKDVDARPAIYHLKEEVDELLEALNSFEAGHKSVDEYDKKLKKVEEGYADCIILLLDSMIRFDSYIDIKRLLYIIKEKHKINKKRKWCEPDENGITHHIEE